MALSAERLKRSKLFWILLVLGVVLLAGRLAGPSIAAAVVRKSLHELKGGYHGDIDEVDLSVMTGEVHILGMQIVKSNGLVPVPFIQIKDFTLGLVPQGWSWRTVLTLNELSVSLVDADAKAKQQWGPDFKLEELREKLPAELTALHIRDGQVHFRNFEAKPQVDAYVHNLEGDWENLDGCLPPGWPTCQSTVKAKAAVMGSGALLARGTFDREKGAKMQATAELDNLRPKQLNPALLEYVKIDAQNGRIDVDVRYSQHKEAQRLVLVPRLYNVDIAGNDTEQTSWIREAAAGVAAGWFERKRGKKAIAYKKSGAKGEWSLIDWGSDRAEDNAQGRADKVKDEAESDEAAERDAKRDERGEKTEGDDAKLGATKGESKTATAETSAELDRFAKPATKGVMADPKADKTAPVAKAR